MADSIRVSWDQNSKFVHLVRALTARRSSRYRGSVDPLEPLSEVWAGLKIAFIDGQLLKGQAFGRMVVIINRRVANYYRSKGVRPIEQPGTPHFDLQDVQNIKSPLDPPESAEIERERFGLIDKELSELPPPWAEAVRSRYGFSGAPEWGALAEISGTTRQNISKRLKKGMEALRSLLVKSHREIL